MKARTQYDAIGRLITRARGATALEMMHAADSTCVHKRMQEMRRMGWQIERKPIKGKTYGRYVGMAPCKGGA